MRLLTIDSNYFVICTHWSEVEEALDNLYIGEINQLRLEIFDENSPYQFLDCLWDEGENATLELTLNNGIPGHYYWYFAYGLESIKAIFKDYFEGKIFDFSQWVPMQKRTALQKAKMRWVKNNNMVECFDVKVQIMINKQLGRLPLSTIYLADIEKLTTLKCDHTAGLIKQYPNQVHSETLSIELLMLAVNLNNLNLSSNNFNHYHFDNTLLHLKNMVSLNVCGSNIKSLWSLRYMRRLKTLMIKGCPFLDDAEALFALPKLQFLEADEDFIERFQLREKLPNVTFNSLLKDTSMTIAEVLDFKLTQQEWESLGLRAMQESRWMEAINYYQKSLSQRSDYEIYRRISYCYKMMGQPDQEEVYLEKGAARFPYQSHLEKLLKFYHSRYQYRKCLILAEALVQHGILVDEAMDYRKDCQWHFSGQCLHPFPAQSEDNPKAKSFQDLLKAIGQLYQEADAAPKMAADEDKLFAAEILKTRHYFEEFFYDNFTRTWSLLKCSMRPVYRSCLNEILLSALNRDSYHQEDGTADYHLEFADEGVIFKHDSIERTMAWRDFYWFLRMEIVRFCARYKPIGEERDLLWQRLGWLKEDLLLPFVDDTPLGDILQTAEISEMQDKAVAEAKEVLAKEAGTVDTAPIDDTLAAREAWLSLLLEQGAVHLAIDYLERLNCDDQSWLIKWQQKAYWAGGYYRAAEQVLKKMWQRL